MMQAFALVSPDRLQNARRKEITLGCIVNTRKDMGLSDGRTFGLFLGSFLVHHAVPSGIRLADLTREIGRQTRAIKRNRLYLGAALELALGSFLVSFFSEQRRRRLYRKNYPLWGGLTNMNLNTLWPQPDKNCPVDYFRAVSTGPITPLVVSLTTVGEVANVGLSYQPGVFNAAEMERIQHCLRNPLALLAN